MIFFWGINQMRNRQQNPSLCLLITYHAILAVTSFPVRLTGYQNKVLLTRHNRPGNCRKTNGCRGHGNCVRMFQIANVPETTTVFQRIVAQTKLLMDPKYRSYKHGFQISLNLNKCTSIFFLIFQKIVLCQWSKRSAYFESKNRKKYA